MTTLTLRNRRLPAFAATEAKNEFGQVLETALRSGAVAITKHDAVKAVLLSVEEYEKLLPPAGELDLLTAEFDALLGEMQTARARQAAWDAFHAPPGADSARRRSKRRPRR